MRILAIGLALLASVARADDVAPWEVPPPARVPDQSVDGGLRAEIPSLSITSFQRLESGRGPDACMSAADVAAAGQGAAGIPELLARVRSGGTARERIGAAAALGSIIPEGRDALLTLLAASSQDTERLAIVAGLPPGDAASIAATIRWHPLPTGTEDLDGLFGGVFWWAGCPRYLDFEPDAHPEHVTLACLTWDLVADEDERSIPALVQLLATQDAPTRRGAAWALRNALVRLGAEAPPEAEAALLALAGDPDDRVRIAATAPNCAERTGAEWRRRIALTALGDRNVLVQHAALLALACAGTRRLDHAEAALLSRFACDPGHAHADAALAAALALAGDPDTADLDILLSSCSSNGCSWAARDVARRSIALHRRVLVPRIHAHLQQLGATQALWLLVEWGIPLPVEPCLRLLASDDVAKRIVALRMLTLAGASARASRDAVLNVLRRATDDSIRSEAARTLLAVAPDDVEAIHAAFGAIDERWWRCSLTPATTKRTLKLLTADEDAGIRRAAWSALIEKAPSIAEATALERRAHGDPAVADEARNALARHSGRKIGLCGHE